MANELVPYSSPRYYTGQAVTIMLFGHEVDGVIEAVKRDRSIYAVNNNEWLYYITFPQEPHMRYSGIHFLESEIVRIAQETPRLMVNVTPSE